MSSIASLTMDIMITRARGTTAVYDANGEIDGID
jgi:hypothetical protein